MKGKDITEIKQVLKLNREEMAKMCGVHPTTIYRWEKNGKNEISGIEPMQAGILLKLLNKIKNNSKEINKISRDIKNALLIGGAIFGLYILLKALFDE